MSSPGVIRWPSRPRGAAGVFVHGKFSGEECKLQESRDLLCDQREQNGGEVRGMELSWWCSGVALAHGSPRESFNIVEQIIAKHQLTVLSKGKRDPRYGSTRGKGDGQVWRVLQGEPGAQGWRGGFVASGFYFSTLPITTASRLGLRTRRVSVGTRGSSSAGQCGEGMGWPGLSRSAHGPSGQKAPTQADILCLQGINFNEHLCK